MVRFANFLCGCIRQGERRQPIAADAPPFASFYATPGFTNPLS